MIKQLPIEERPREKLLARGPQVLSDAELLAVFLGTGMPGCDVMTLAQDLLSRFNGMRGLIHADRKSLLKAPGLGAAKLAMLLASLELTERYLAEGFRREDVISDPVTTRKYLRNRLAAYPHEVFACLFLDNQHRLIAYEELFFGTIDGASVHPREVVRKSLERNAAAVIFAHNHPSGIAEPSQADQRITARLKSALALIDVRVLDHMVVGEGEIVSFAERGIL